MTLIVSVNKELWTGTVPVNKELLTGTVPVNKELLTGRVPVNNLFLNNIIMSLWLNHNYQFLRCHSHPLDTFFGDKIYVSILASASNSFLCVLLNSHFFSNSRTQISFSSLFS